MSRISAAINNLVVCVEAGLSPAIEEDEKKDDTSDGQTTKTNRPKLTICEIAIIAKILVSDGAYGTCAALNVVSKCVWAVTIPILWKTFVIWGAKLHNDLSIFWDAGDIESEQGKAIVGSWSKKWDMAMESVGALFIKYLVVPPIGRPVLPSTPDNTTSVTRPRFPPPQVKASINIVALPDMDDHEGGRHRTVLVKLTEIYRPGTSDSFDFLDALSLLHESGNQRVKDAFHGADGIMIVPCSSSVSNAAVPDRKRIMPLPAVKYAIARLTALRRDLSCRLTLSKFNVCSPGMPTSHGTALVFLDTLHWIKFARGESHNGTIDVRHNNSEVIIACAKAYQKAVKVNPAFVSLWCRFTLYSDISPAILSEMEKAVAIIRGTYLLTRPHLSLDQLGVFTLKVQSSSGKLAWFIVAERHNDRIATILFSKGGFTSTMYDIWGANNQ